jgi:hypothetical protein
MSKYEYAHLNNQENTLALFHGVIIKVSAQALHFTTQISKRFASYRHFDRGNSD